MEEDSLAGLFFGIYIFLNFLHTCMLTIFIMKLQKNKALINGQMMHGDANPYCVGNLMNRTTSAETLAQVAEYEDPMNHSENNYAEVDHGKTEKYDALDYMQLNTKKSLSYDKLKILAEENQKND